MFVQASSGKDTERTNSDKHCRAQTRRSLACQARKKLSLEQGKKLLEDTKTRLRLEQEARTRERIEQIEFERFDRLGVRLYNEYWTLEGATDSQSELLSEEDENNNPQNPPSNTETIEESSSSHNPNEVCNFTTLKTKEQRPSSNTNTSVTKMQKYNVDDLIDYNEVEEDNKSSGQYAKGESSGQRKTPSPAPDCASHSPKQTPPSLRSDEDSDEVDSDLGKGQDTNMDIEEGQEIEMDSTSTQQAFVERKQKEFDTLTAKLEENGWRLRYKVFQDPLQSHLAISMNSSTRTLAEILQYVPVEDAEQISEFQGTVYMPLHFLEKYLLPSMQLRKLMEVESTTSGSQPLSGGPETAILYSLYHQTKMTRSSTQTTN